MNKLIISVGIICVAIASIWVNRIDLLLAAVKFQSEREFARC